MLTIQLENGSSLRNSRLESVPKENPSKQLEPRSASGGLSAAAETPGGDKGRATELKAPLTVHFEI